MLFKKRWLLAALLASGGIPYAMSPSTGMKGLAAGAWERRPRLFSGDAAAPVVETSAVELAEKEAPPRPATSPAPQPVTTANLDDIFRYDVSTNWVLGRWPRVSTGLGNVDLQGYRVPLVTGTAPHDLAGSLTYYFNRRQQLERITFRGTTGDVGPLVALLALQHGFLRQVSDDPGVQVYQIRYDGQAESELRIRTARVVRADAPNSRYEVSLVMNRPQRLR